MLTATEDALLEADAAYDAADKRAREAFVRWARAQRHVQWKQGQHIQTGRVVDVSDSHSYHIARLKVESLASGKQYWINADRFVSLIKEA